MGERDGVAVSLVEGVAVSLVEGVAVGAVVGEGVMAKDEVDMEEDEVDMEKDEVDMEEDEVALEKFDDMEEDVAENISVKLRNMETIRGNVPFPSVN